MLPGSHREPVHEHVPDRRPDANYGYVEIVDHDMAASVPVLMDPGDLLLFDSHLMHRSTDNESDGVPRGDGVPLLRHRHGGAHQGPGERLRDRAALAAARSRRRRRYGLLGGERLVVRRGFALGHLVVDRRRALLVEGGEVLLRPLTDQVALATFDEPPQPGTFLAELVGAGRPRDPTRCAVMLSMPSQSSPVDVGPAVVLAPGERAGGEAVRRAARAGTARRRTTGG